MREAARSVNPDQTGFQGFSTGVRRGRGGAAGLGADEAWSTPWPSTNNGSGERADQTKFPFISIYYEKLIDIFRNLRHSCFSCDVVALGFYLYGLFVRDDLDCAYPPASARIRPPEQYQFLTQGARRHISERKFKKNTQRIEKARSFAKVNTD